MPYYILKTGMPMYDLERAYGLGLLAYTVTSEETRVFDKGLYFEIRNPKVDDSMIRKKTSEIISLVAENIDSWDNALRTTKGKEARKKKKEKASQLLKTESRDILNYYSSISQSEQKATELLTAPVELASTKGFREQIRCRKYDEGSELKISSNDWVVCIIGALHAVSWQFVPLDENIVIIPSPDEEKGIDVSHLKDIKNFLQTRGLNRISTLTIVAHSAIKLYQELWNRRQDQIPWTDVFSRFVYGSLVGAARQSKPKTGGFFSLEIFDKLLEVDNGSAIFEHFDYIFKVGNRQGQKALSISFAEFLTKPSLENYSKFLNIYMRTLLRGEKVRKPDEKVWGEIMKFVEV